MKYLLAIGIVAMSSITAHAATKCDFGSPDVFDFVSWQFKKSVGPWMEMKLTYRNKLDLALKTYEMRVLVDDVGVGVSSKEPVKPGGEATTTMELDMSQEDADKFQQLTPLLCAIGVEDETGNHRSFY
jgi:hypothetical protein